MNLLHRKKETSRTGVKDALLFSILFSSDERCSCPFWRDENESPSSSHRNGNYAYSLPGLGLTRPHLPHSDTRQRALLPTTSVATTTFIWHSLTPPSRFLATAPPSSEKRDGGALFLPIPLHHPLERTTSHHLTPSSVRPPV